MVRIMFTEAEVMGSLYDANRHYIGTNMNLKSGDERGHYKKLIEIGISGHVCQAPWVVFERINWSQTVW